MTAIIRPFPLHKEISWHFEKGFFATHQLHYLSPTLEICNAGNFAREGEEATILWWEEFLHKLDSSDSEGLLPQVLVFITGADNIPNSGFPDNIDIDFFDYKPGVRWFPTPSTRGFHFTLPRGVPADEEFIIQALEEGFRDFGKL